MDWEERAGGSSEFSILRGRGKVREGGPEGKKLVSARCRTAGVLVSMVDVSWIIGTGRYSCTAGGYRFVPNSRRVVDGAREAAGARGHDGPSDGRPHPGRNFRSEALLSSQDAICMSQGNEFLATGLMRRARHEH